MSGRAEEQPSAEVRMSMTAVCKVVEIPPDGGLRVEMPGRPAVAVFIADGAFYVIDDLCTHGDASLADGMIEDMEVICPYHMGSFDLRTGAAVKAPCSIPIKSYATEARDGVLYALIQPA